MKDFFGRMENTQQWETFFFHIRNYIILYIVLYVVLCQLDDEQNFFLQFLLTNDKSKPPNHKKLIFFTLVCLCNVQIQILNQPKRPS